MEICTFGLSKGLTGAAFYGCGFVVSLYLKGIAFKAVEMDAKF